MELNIVPLILTDKGTFRINEIDKEANDELNNYLNLKRNKYTGFDFEFKPY